MLQIQTIAITIVGPWEIRTVKVGERIHVVIDGPNPLGGSGVIPCCEQHASIDHEAATALCKIWSQP